MSVAGSAPLLLIMMGLIPFNEDMYSEEDGKQAFMQDCLDETVEGNLQLRAGNR